MNREFFVYHALLIFLSMTNGGYIFKDYLLKIS